MLPTFVIGLREGVEAALIVGIVAAFLRQEGRRDALRWVWLGVGRRARASAPRWASRCRCVDDDLPQRQQEGLETVVALVAVAMVTVHDPLDAPPRPRRWPASCARAPRAALAQGSVGALVGMAFFAVIREGMETAVFLLAAFQSATNPTTAGLGALLGVLVAAAASAGASTAAACSINLARFFRVTGFVLVLVAAGLVANGAAHRARGGLDQQRPGPGRRPQLARRPRHVDRLAAHRHARPAAAARPWSRRSAISSTPSRWRCSCSGRSAGACAAPRGLQSAAPVAALLLVLVLFVAGCGSSSSAPAAAARRAPRSSTVKLTDAGCAPAQLKLDGRPDDVPGRERRHVEGQRVRGPRRRPDPRREGEPRRRPVRQVRPQPQAGPATRSAAPAARAAATGPLRGRRRGRGRRRAPTRS